MKGALVLAMACALAACSGGNSEPQAPMPTVPALEFFAGDSVISGYVDASGTAARFGFVAGIATDGSSNVWVADDAPTIRAVRKITPQGSVSTIAGGGSAPAGTDGVGTAAGFYGPRVVAVDRFNNVHVTDVILTGSSGVVNDLTTIRKIAPDGTVTTLAIPGRQYFGVVRGMTSDAEGNLYVSEGDCEQLPPPSPTTCFGQISRISAAGIAVRLVATPGAGGTSSILMPSGIAIDSNRNIYVADLLRATINRITPSGAIEAVAGNPGDIGSNDGTGTAARFNQPMGLAIDGSDNLYVADSGNHTIRKVTPSGVVTTIAGVPGQPGFAPGMLPGMLRSPRSVAISGSNLYISQGTAIAVVRNRP